MTSPLMSLEPAAVLVRLETALAARIAQLDPRHEGALRLWNGFLEGCPELVVELYARTLVIHNYANPPALAEAAVAAVAAALQARWDWLRAVVVKTRFATTEEARQGVLLAGEAPDRRLCEDGVWYALELTLHRDTSFYLDTRGLRAWIRCHLAGKSVLNTFACTGSLGVAALAAGAARVVQTDRNRRFLNVAKTSLAINRLPVPKGGFVADDFWAVTSRLRRAGESFDCVLLDPPFQAQAPGGQVDLLHEYQRLLNKVRPLVADDGWLVAVNNALFLSGADYRRSLEELTADGYLSVEELIPVPADVTGYPETVVSHLPADPTPFNHATKIAVLRVRKR